jgi:hypothetical protein
VIEPGSFIAGAAAGSGAVLLLSIFVVGLVSSDLKRVRLRLAEIIQLARRQDIEWTRRRMTGDDWNELVLVIQPYEEA